MDAELKERALRAGLEQLTTAGLKRLAQWRGKMLLNGAIYEDGMG